MSDDAKFCAKCGKTAKIKKDAERMSYFTFFAPILTILIVMVGLGYLFLWSVGKLPSYLRFNTTSDQNVQGTTTKQIYPLQHGSFSMFFPQKPILSTSKQDFGNGNNVLTYTYTFSTSSDKNTGLAAAYSPSAIANLNSFSPQDNLKNELGYTANESGSKIISSSITSYNGLPAIDYLLYNNLPNTYVVGKDIAKGTDIYSLEYAYYTGQENKTLENTFFNSLTFSAVTQDSNDDSTEQPQSGIQNTQTISTTNSTPDLPNLINEWSPNVALILCTFANGDADFGSGFLTHFTDGSIDVITNRHVITDETTGYVATKCGLEIPGDTTTYIENGSEFQLGSLGDWGFIPVEDGDVYFNSVAIKNLQVCQQQEQTGDNVVVLGYPDYAGQFNNPTATEGIVSGYAAPYYTTSAQIESGNSGGVAIDPDKDCYVGIPSAVKLGNYSNLGRILSADVPFKLSY